MKIALCDDEKEIRNHMSEMIMGMYKDADIIQFNSGMELLDNMKICNDIDIIFLDIALPDKNGLDIARVLRDMNSKTIIIFVTGLEEYVYQAFDVNAFNYLLKPIKENKFKEVLRKAVNQINCKTDMQIDNAVQYIVVKTKGLTKRIMMKDIVYAEVFNRSIVLHLEKETVQYYGKMKDLEIIAGNDFFRTHRAFLINLKYVTGYEARKVYLNKSWVILSKSNYAGFVKAFLHYHERNDE